MPTLTVTAKGQITLRKEILQHLGVDKGGKVDVELGPDGGALIKAAKPKGDIRELFGCLSHLKRDKPLTIDEMNEITADGWAGRLDEKND